MSVMLGLRVPKEVNRSLAVLLGGKLPVPEMCRLLTGPWASSHSLSAFPLVPLGLQKALSGATHKASTQARRGALGTQEPTGAGFPVATLPT